MKKLILLLMMCLLIISCEKKIDYPVYKRAEKKAMYKEAKDNEDQEKLKEIQALMDRLEIEGKKGDEVAYREFAEWDEVVKLYIAPPKKYKKPDLLNGKW
ncbi:hypothetical protein KST01_03730 [Fusobacterium animalis]|uniref:hypothetical protein n=1 Tax=Fusobacterium animalis TaxID=76859 RepID=UPI0030D2A85E